MKFILALLFTLALAMGVQSSILPLHAWHGDWNDHDDGQWHGDWHDDWHGHDDGQWHGDLHGDDWHDGHQAAVILGAHHAHSPALIVDNHHAHVHSPALIVDDHHLHAHAPIVHVAHPHHEGHYLAKTRGAVHSAPLAGHAASAASINLQPAPGTVW